MGQKINPVSLRLHYTNRHFDNCWYSNYFYKNLITRDLFLQRYFNNFKKLLKLPSGRYSIQHLQKKTQVYNFLCYSKSTREWRSKIFGLFKNKNSLKKARYFFKKTPEFRKKTRKQTKLSFFYKTLNQMTVHKIQKKITSFQNLKLWSLLFKNQPHFSISTPQTLNKFFLFPVNNLMTTRGFQIENLETTTPLLVGLSQTIEKTKKKRVAPIEKFNGSEPLILKKSLAPVFSSMDTFKDSYQSSQLNNSTLFFLQNLFIYKALKSDLPQTPFASKFFSNSRIWNHLEKRSKKKSTTILLNKRFQIQEFGTNSLLLNFKYKNYLETCLSSFYKVDVNLTPFKVKNDWQHANYLADELVYFLEKRIPFRRLKTKILQQLSKIPEIRGVRITCSGRVGGKSKKAQRAKTECIKYGQTSLQVFSSKIDFAVKTAFTSFGSVGVKVWICYN